jgi:hypothetical protein
MSLFQQPAPQQYPGVDPRIQQYYTPPPPTQDQQQVDAMNYMAQQQYPKYTGDPTVDKFIHMFIGGQ